MGTKKKPDQLPVEAQLLEDMPDPKPIFCTRQGLKPLFGLNAQSMANLAGKKHGCKYYRRGKLAFYMISDVVEWLTRHPVLTSEEGPKC